MPNTLTITVTNLFSDSATVMGSIFNSSANFPTGAKFASFSGIPESGDTQVQIDVDGLPDGQYAVALFQDMNEFKLLPNVTRLSPSVKYFVEYENHRATVHGIKLTLRFY